MNESFFLNGEKEIENDGVSGVARGVLIRSWAILNFGPNDLHVTAHSNNAPRTETVIIQSGEQFIDAACSISKLVLVSLGADVQIFHSRASQSQWRFKTEQKPAVLATMDETEAPSLQQNLPPVKPALEEEPEPRGTFTDTVNKFFGRSS